ncbi:MAG TPA: DinB family protein [Candidatus Acidoferrales bacterium]
MNVEDFLLLYDFNPWANRRTLDSCAVLTESQFVQDLGSSFPSIRDTLAHSMLVEWVWLERWHNRAPDKYPPASDFPNLASIRARWSEIERNLLDYIAALKPEELHRVVHHKTMAGAPQAQPLWQMLQHLVNHGSYHRGQVATMLRQSNEKPVGTDLITFYRERAAKAQA